MSNHQNIEDLFRSKLGEAEITPSKGAWKGVQRKLRMKQFLRFDAGKFNVWYAGALLVAGATAFVLLNNSPSESTAPEVKEAPVLREIAESDRESGIREEKRRRPVTGRKPDRTGEAAKREAAKDEEGKRGLTENKKQAERTEQSAGMFEKEAPEGKKSEETDSTSFHPGLVTQFTASETMGCAPLRVEFRNESMGASGITWNFGNGEHSEVSDPVYIFETAGIYAVSLTATGAAGDSGVYYQVIRVYPAPVAGFEMGEGLEQPDGSISVELMNYSTGAYSYSWEMLSSGGEEQEGWTANEFQPTFNNSDIPVGASLIRMVALNEHGCTDTAVAEIIALSSAQRTLTFPTVFSGNTTGPTGGYYTPNDLRLDIFHPHFSEQPAEYHLRVYSKMGEVIFETRDILQGWDGYYMEVATAGGVYLWVATGTWQNGATFNLKGDVTLLWNNR